MLEVAIYAFVPSAAAILADWGADVLKVEHPVLGDPGRNTAAWGVPADVNGVSHLWEVANRGKRAMTLDIATPEGKEILLQLVDESDVFVTNFLPPARRKLGIEPEDIMGRNPRIIYARGSAQGPRGELSERGGFDGVTYWTRTGASLGVTPPEAAVPLAMPGPGFGDLQSGMALAGGIGTALYHRERTGEGTVVDVSLMSMGLWAMGMTISGTSVLDADALPHQYHRELDQPAGQRVPHQGRRLHRHGLPAVRPLLAGVLRARRALRLAGRRALRRLGRPRREPDGARRAARRAVRSSGPSPSGRSCSPSRTASGTRVLPGRSGAARRAGAGQRLRAARRARRRRQDRARRRARSSSTVRCPTLGKAPAFGADTDDVLRAHGRDDDAIADLRARGVIA